MEKKPRPPRLDRPAEPQELPTPPDPLGQGRLRRLLFTLGVLCLIVWGLGGLLAGFSTSGLWIGVGLGVPAVVTVGLVGVLGWVLLQARKARRVLGVLSGVKTAEDRQAAIEQLEAASRGGKDVAAVFAKAQLLLQEDPRAALATLETIRLDKVPAPVADETRGQRAMIHLLLGDVTAARDLADGIELKGQQEAGSRAMLGAVVAEAWARTGQSKKAIETLALFPAEAPDFAAVKTQLYRAQAFAFAYGNQLPAMRTALRRLMDEDARLLAGFLGKRTHPLLQKEAKQLLERSGQMQRKMVIQRR